ncbi:MAG: hypothetical protein AABO58_15770 [Acidobacteriota bacterium]
MTRLTLALLLLLSAGALHAAPRRRAVTPAQFPPCHSVAGTPAVTFSRDGGATVAPRQTRLSGIGYTYGIAVLDRGETLLSAHDEVVSVSRDAGCNWEIVGRVNGPDLFPPSITVAPDGRAYIWSDNRQILARYAAGSLTALALATRYRKPMKAAIVGASAAGTALALLYARLGAYNQRIGDPIDAAAQIRCLFSHPTRFLRAVAHDIPAHAGIYLEQLVGRFGGVAQVGLPVVIVAIEFGLLIVVGLPVGAPPSRRLDRRRPAAESGTLSGQPARTPALLIVALSFRSS